MIRIYVHLLQFCLKNLICFLFVLFLDDPQMGTATTTTLNIITDNVAMYPLQNPLNIYIPLATVCTILLLMCIIGFYIYLKPSCHFCNRPQPTREPEQINMDTFRDAQPQPEPAQPQPEPAPNPEPEPAPNPDDPALLNIDPPLIHHLPIPQLPPPDPAFHRQPPNPQPLNPPIPLVNILDNHQTIRKQTNRPPHIPGLIRLPVDPSTLYGQRTEEEQPKRHNSTRRQTDQQPERRRSVCKQTNQQTQQQQEQPEPEGRKSARKQTDQRTNGQPAPNLPHRQVANQQGNEQRKRRPAPPPPERSTSNQRTDKPSQTDPTDLIDLSSSEEDSTKPMTPQKIWKAPTSKLPVPTAKRTNQKKERPKLRRSHSMVLRSHTPKD